MEKGNYRVLSIQSHVVHGYVGNKSAVFPLQLHGFEVDIINSVQLSNHTGYKKWTGQVLTSVDLGDLLDGLKTNDLLRKYTHLLTGYIGSASFLEKVADVIMELKKIKPDLLYVCDPVMGDNGQLYVPESLLPVYKEKIIPLADIITPNQFELQLLTDVEIRNESDVLKAIDILHDRGVKTVAVSSTELGSEDTLIAYGSYNDPEASQSSKLKVEFPKLPIQFTGSGDLFAASLLIWMTKTDCNLMESYEKTIGTLHDVLKRTLEHIKKNSSDGHRTADQLELRLIQSKEDIENPKTCVKCIVL